MVDKILVPSPSSSMPNNHVEVDGINGIATFQQNRSPASSFKNANPNGLVRVIVRFLDSSNSAYDVSSKSLGRTLFLQVCESISVQLFESDFFCLQWWSNGSMYWLDLDKPICKQLSLPGKNIAMYFAVKFYTVEPLKLEDELSRYLFALQIKKDLAEGYLICSPSVSAMLASFIVQAECGDFNNEEYSNHLYISKIKLIPQQDEEFEIKVMENHKLLVGMPPAQADLQLLELAKDQEMYGIKLTPCKDHECVPLNLAATHHGILIFQNHTKVNTFDWSKIRKLSFKRKHFFIKLHQEEFFGDVLEFVFQHRNECKNFWKKCIEQHSFFKCIDIKRKSRQKLRIFSRGSSFRYAGRTQQQLSELVKENKSRKQKSFQRSSSMKLNSVREDDNLGYSSDANDPKELQTDSISYTASIKQMHKSCDTLDQDSASINALSLNGNPHQTILSGFQNMNLSSVNLHSTLEFRGFKRQMNQDYYVFRDLVMAERTYLKDFELMQRWFEKDVSKEPSQCTHEMFSLLHSVLEPLIEFHKSFLIDIEYLLYIWDKDGIEELPPLSQILCSILKWLSNYEQFIERLPFIMELVHSNFCHNSDFERICREFEAKKGCYMPYSSFLLKPAFHVSYFAKMIQKLVDCYCANHCDYLNLRSLVEQLNNFNYEYSSTLESLINLVILIELQRDVTGLDNIVQSGRRFVREGCLLKLSKKGFQQRLFFLFSDLLIYASRSTSVNFQFKIHGYFLLHNVFVEETESKSGSENCFALYAGDKIIILGAMSESDRQAWIRDIKETTLALSLEPSSQLQPPIVPNDLLDKIDSALSEHWKGPLGHSLEFDQLQTTMQSRTNTIVHVCWQRACSISAADYRYALTVSFSGYLLRKFKNCSGWQKLWVEFTHFCLFFYKSSDDDYPLASLPVLDYTVSLPCDEDKMRKHVFKLQFKTHIYFFRAESEYAFANWMEVIKRSNSDREVMPKAVQ